jgi:8-oxo-dGTP pyrophosphatase MutT (NUDIX family)
MTQGDGNGWVGCDRDHRHWGRHGAAGLLLWAPDSSGRPLVLLIRRAGWSHHGGTWGPPGGARDSHESPAEAAMREAAEECGAPPGAVHIHGLLNDDHGGWSYQTLIGQATEPFTVRPSQEATETAWIPADDVASLALHPGFAATWPVIREALAPVTLIVDGANVMGSRADGWWRDRAGAMMRLHGELAVLAAGGCPAPGRCEWWPPRGQVTTRSPIWPAGCRDAGSSSPRTGNCGGAAWQPARPSPGHGG